MGDGYLNNAMVCAVEEETFDEVTNEDVMVLPGSAAGIRSLNQNCRQLRSLNISSCDRVNGEGFKGFSTLACLEAYNCEFYSMKDVVSGGGLEYLNLSGLEAYNCEFYSKAFLHWLQRLFWFVVLLCIYVRND
ncbi:F-box domain, Leucine-rich repeat domain, L domain-like protein [Artemisia annua]|uniref:F-box domain, Leucine-rich repeat domain, L domain-like protein n=1 Tax=Artemisia annua TaxID=35608 RepID=A0A2U1L772_ARTAN|nr:F-box domain, Leucine-rich repeat domain, L domain-like protein [Artemisia annua]